MNRIVTTLLIGGLTLGGFTLANAAPTHIGMPKQMDKSCGKHEMNRESQIEKMIERLDLDDGQANQVRNIRDNYQSQMETLSSKMRDSRQQLREITQVDVIDQAQINMLAKTIGDLKTEKILLKTAMRVEIHTVLTEEQRETMKNLKRDRGLSHGRRLRS